MAVPNLRNSMGPETVVNSESESVQSADERSTVEESTETSSSPLIKVYGVMEATLEAATKTEVEQSPDGAEVTGR